MIFRRIALLLVIVALVGCNNEKNRNLIDRRADQATRMGQEAQKPAPKKPYNPLTVSDKVWSGSTSLRLRRGLPLPSKYEAARGVTLIASEPVTLNDIAMSLGSQTGIPVRVSTGADASGGGIGAVEAKMPVAYEGPLSGLLDLVAGNFGLNWKYDGSSIRMSKFETRVFTVEALPGTQTFKDGVKEETSSGGASSSTTAGFSVSGGSSLQQTSEMNVELKVWDEINATLTSILGGVGTVSVSPSSGTATVTTTPELMGAVAKYIEEENLRLTRQVAINVEVYSISLSEGTNFDFTFDTIVAKLNQMTNATYASAAGPTVLAGDNAVTGLGKLSMAILKPNKGGHTTSIFQAISEVGDATRVAQFPVTTLNNRTVTRRVGTDRTYVAAVSNSTTSTTAEAITSSVTPGTVREGFSLQLTPRVLDDGRIMLQYSMSLTDIVDFSSFGGVQLPETSNRVFVQQAMLKSGSTLIIGGHDDEAVSQSSKGVGNAYNYFLGGGSANEKRRAMMFIAITPQVIDVSAKAEQE